MTEGVAELVVPNVVVRSQIKIRFRACNVGGSDCYCVVHSGEGLAEDD